MSSKKKKPAVQSPQEKVQPVESKPVEVVEEEAPEVAAPPQKVRHIEETLQEEATRQEGPQEPLPPVETTEEEDQVPVPPGMIRFQVSGPIASLSHGQAVYPVTLGRVDLPAGEKWYQSLVAAGELSRRLRAYRRDG